MIRSELIARISENKNNVDVIVIGGGATGLGCALDATSRGYKTLLLEQHDFGKGTSSKSTKLIHGGVRYLKQGNVSFVMESLKERGILMQNAPHLVKNQAFIVPNYHWWEGPFYGVGLKVYDRLAGTLGFGTSKILSVDETLANIPSLSPEGLRGGVLYYDGQFDDARLAVNLAQTIDDLGGIPINYFRANTFIKQNGFIKGLIAQDMISEKEYEIRAKVVINATGAYCQEVMKMDDAETLPLLAPSQGVHIVLTQKFLPNKTAIMVPRTKDKRVIFAVPWYNHVIVGTTDTPVQNVSLEPDAFEDEISYLLEHIAIYLSLPVTKNDICSVFTGLRPLVKTGTNQNTAGISRDHYLSVSASGLITITGGKWTTYRKMAEDTIDEAIIVGHLEEKPCRTKSLKIHGGESYSPTDDPLRYLGSDIENLHSMIKTNPSLAVKLHPDFDYVTGLIHLAIRDEYAQTLEDMLARRMRLLYLNVDAAKSIATLVADEMKNVLQKDSNWASKQINEFTLLAKKYSVR